MQAAYASEYQEFEQHHWWFRARRQILRDHLSSLALPSAPSILEIGVGPGENLYSIYPAGAVLAGVEPDSRLASIARTRGPIPVLQATIETLPSTLADGSFDVVTLLDVLEHTKDDLLALRCARAKVAPGGYAVVSVPAYMFLWNQQDVVNEHYRRYTRKELVAKLDESGFEVLRATYFCTLLFAPVAAYRLVHRLFERPAAAPETDLKISLGPLDEMLYAIFLSEKWLLRWMNLPVGTSVLAVAKRR